MKLVRILESSIDRLSSLFYYDFSQILKLNKRSVHVADDTPEQTDNVGRATTVQPGRTAQQQRTVSNADEQHCGGGVDLIPGHTVVVDERIACAASRVTGGSGEGGDEQDDTG